MDIVEECMKDMNEVCKKFDQLDIPYKVSNAIYVIRHVDHRNITRQNSSR